MKFFALLCIVLLVSSLPASFSQAAQAESTQAQNTETSNNETTQESQTTADANTTPVEPTPTESANAGIDSTPVKEETPAAAPSENTPAETPVQPESSPKEETKTQAPAEVKPTEQESTEQKNTEEPKTSTTESETATPAADANVTSASTNTTSSSVDTQAEVEPKNGEAAPAPASEGTNTKDNGEKPQSGAVVEDSNENEGVKEAFSIISKIIGVVLTLCVIGFVGCIYNYRYQMDKYKIPPFTPPTFCPDFIFPRSNRNRGTSYGYSELEVSDYRAPNFSQL